MNIQLISKTFLITLLFIFSPLCVYADDHEEDEIDHQELIEEIHDIWPEIEKHLTLSKEDLNVLKKFKERLIKEQPEELLERLEHYLDLIEHDGPEILNMEMESHVLEYKVELLVDRFHQANSDQEKKDLKQNIRKQLAILMDVRLKHRIQEFEHLSQELDRIKKGIDAVKKDPDRFIDKKLSELLEDHFDPFE